MAMVSCSQDEEQWVLGGDTFEDFTGEIVTDGSRTSMGTDGSVLWSENDTISLFKKTGYHQKYKVAASGSASTTFKYGGYSSGKGATQTMHYAVYPFAEGNSVSGTTLTLDLSSLATQSYTANTFENGKAVMVAKSENTALRFTNAFSLVNFQLTAQAGEAPDEKILVNSIKVESATLPLAGTATVDMSQEKPAAVFASTGSKSITLTCENTVELSATTATNFYVLMPAVTFPANDLTITIHATVAEEAKEYVVTMTSEVPLLRSKVTTLTKTLEFDDWTGVTSAIVVDVEDVTAANTALATNAGVKIADASSATGTTAITVPAKEDEAAAEVSHVIDLSEATMPVGGTAVNIVVTEGDGSATNTVETLEVIVPEGTTSQSLNIDAPGTTVTVTAADGTVIDVIEAATAEQTLVINENVTVKKLIVKKGNVRIKGKVESVESDINTTITLDNDIILDSPLTVSGTGQIILDLNGKTLSYTNDVLGESMITNNGDLTIKNGTVTYNYTGENDASYSKGNYAICNYGKLTVEADINAVAGTVGTKFSHAFYAIQSAGNTVINSGKILNNTNVAIRQWIGSETQTSELTINGGEIEGLRGIWMQLPGSDTSKAPLGTLTIKDGTITGTAIDGKQDSENVLAIYSYSYGNDMKNVKISISGGTFNGDVALTGGKNKTNVETLNITGGTFNGLWGDVYSYGDDALAAKAITVKGGEFSSLAPLAYLNSTDEVVKLGKDIDLNNEQWTPIGTSENPFIGTFNAQNHTIKNLSVVEDEAKEGKAYIGLFGYAKDATIQNVTFENVNLNIACLDIDHSQGHIGAVAGSLEGTSIVENVTVKGDIKVEATFDANGASRVAVVAGGNSYGNVTMKNVHVIANDGSYLKANNNVGALAGQLQGQNVFENCSSNIDVTGKKFFAGGLIGLAAGNSTFTDCHTTGDVTVTAGREGRANDHYRVGGIAGGWADGKKNVCTLTNCSYTGKVSGTNADGSVAETLDYAGYVGRGYNLTNCAGSKVIIDGVSYIQKHEDIYGIYDVIGEDGNAIVSTAEDLTSVLEKV